MIYYQRLESNSGDLFIDNFDNDIVLSSNSYNDDIGGLIIEDYVYLKNTLYPLCLRFKNNELTDTDKEEIIDLEVDFNALLENEIIELLEEAIKKNWI
ncbi:MAG TPA: hypothetical protein PKD00_00130 [Burkholderiales bacterium]|nr:hypothetical protein [Burkholderiales bacterium]